jgi:hypothetical protein
MKYHEQSKNIQDILLYFNLVKLLLFKLELFYLYFT